MGTRFEPKGRIGRFVHEFEETAIAVLLGLMTLLAFVNVVLRYAFNSSLIWSLEVILILFSWLVIFGVSYAFKITSHLGVDAVTNLLPDRGKRICALLAGAVTIAYAFLLLKGSWDYWAPFAALDRTSGQWFPTGWENTRDQAWYVTDQVPPLRWLFGWLEPLINQGEVYEKMPRVVPYFILPFGSALILFRVVQAVVAVARGTRSSLIVSHEAEDEVAEAAETLKRQGA
ncbi:TRAP transporter small permease [Jannaschia pohangensis]|uniref:TRAP transporter small permease protein n=1 Tax=Jannaschia pohangensis TaxID=390807 RepID=A0A1I3I2Z9_9RHOB|nr:TRAP transporter small permease [Jannaschia pohangensis]SFI42217.1 C4-dicarboxylate transporter, DctQ subunit [Jannaschia pohangensis]